MAQINGGSYVYEAIELGNIPHPSTTYYEFGFTRDEHFSILPQTITNFTVQLEATDDDVHWQDVTSTLFPGFPTITAVPFVADTYMAFKNLRLAVTTTNVVNKLTLQYLIKKGGGR